METFSDQISFWHPKFWQGSESLHFYVCINSFQVYHQGAVLLASRWTA